jgi:hypothetical protein
MKNKFLFFIIFSLFIADAADAATTVAAKKYIDEGLATKLDNWPTLAGNANKVLTLNAASTGLEWSTVGTKLTTAYQNGTASLASGWQWWSTGQFNTIRKDLRSGLVSVNLVPQRPTALTIASGATALVATMPSGFYPLGTNNIWCTVAGYGANMEPNPLSAYMTSSGQIYIINASTSSYTIAASSGFGVNFNYITAI